MAETAQELALQDQRISIFRGVLGNNLKALASVLPANMRPEKIARIAIVELQKQPKLLNCSPQSFLLSVMGACALGLELGGPLGQAYLVPYGETCQLIPGYRGLVKLAVNSGAVRRVEGHVVRVGDRFEVEYGTQPKLVHVPESAPIVDGKPSDKWRPGEALAFYAVAFFADGGTQATVMQRWEVDRIRDMSQGYQNALKYKRTDHPWQLHYDEMGIKTAIRRASKLWPQSAEKLSHAVTLDEQAERGEAQSIRLLPDMPELPETPEPTATQEPTPAPETKPEPSTDDKDRAKALQGLIIELGKRKVLADEEQRNWINARLPEGRKIKSRKELTTDDIKHLRAAMEERAPGSDDQ